MEQTISDVTAGVPDPRALARQGYAKLSFGSDDQLAVRFYVDAVEVPSRGKGVFEDREFIEIRIPGGDVMVREIEPEDPYKERFRRQYEAFKAGQEMSVGTALNVASFLKPSMIRQLRSLGVDTLEQLAALDDLAVQKIGMGGLEIRKQSQAFLQAQSDAEYAAKQAQAEEALRSANDKLAAEIESLKEQMKEIQNGKEKKGRA